MERFTGPVACTRQANYEFEAFSITSCFRISPAEVKNVCITVDFVVGSARPSCSSHEHRFVVANSSSWAFARSTISTSAWFPSRQHKPTVYGTELIFCRRFVFIFQLKMVAQHIYSPKLDMCVCFKVGSCWVFIANIFVSPHQQTVLQSSYFKHFGLINRFTKLLFCLSISSDGWCLYTRSTFSSSHVQNCDAVAVRSATLFVLK